MSRKTPSFSQLVDYIDNDVSKSDYYTYNLYNEDKMSIKREFYENSKNVKKRKNGVYLYHEIISLSKDEKVSIGKQAEILKDLIQKYVEERSPEALVFWKMHFDKENAHFHLLISANEVWTSKKIRIEKHRFLKIQKKLEQYRLTRYPELKCKALYNQETNISRTGKEKWDWRRKKKENSKHKIFKEFLHRIFEKSENETELLKNLAKNKLELYKRGKSYGILDLQSKRKYRLKTIGLDEEYIKIKQKNQERMRNM